ncbi:sensor histidine kinase [Thermoactinospora rubra]|uniref:sensor histidine kinase n=1 Tax=Thermoactinospora rubra TaxID=1088767 RepID=UPI000A10B870|nr:sensor histidine kinase [Thermoactinospora rubra]
MTTSARRLAIAVIAGLSVLYVLLAVALYVVRGIAAVTVVVAVTLVVFYVPHYLNMRAALTGRRPRALPVLLLAQALATYVPDFLLPQGWSGVTAPLLGGALLSLVPLRAAVPLVGVMALYQFGVLAYLAGYPDVGLQYALNVLLTSTVIYALARLVRVTAELEQARADLAEAAVLKERLRISRDLHDGLGRSLTAIALKGDLAARLLERDPASARTEVGELVAVAREAAQDVRQVARGYRELSLAGEAHRGAALLEASGVACQVNLADVRLPRAAEEALAWSVREAVTNVLRHSRATTCSITTSAGGSAVRLEVVNDGVDGAAGEPGGGLTGMRERAAQAGGELEAGASGGAFRVVVTVRAP